MLMVALRFQTSNIKVFYIETKLFFLKKKKSLNFTKLKKIE